MSNLTNQYISSSFQGILNLADSSHGLTGTLQSVQDGLGNNSPLQLSTSTVKVKGTLNVSGSLVPDANLKYSLGAPGNSWQHLYVGSGSIYMDNNRVMGLTDNGALQLLAPTVDNNIQLNNNMYFASNDTGSYYGGAQITYLGNGVSGSTTHIYSGQTHAIETNGSLQFNNNINGYDTGSGGNFQFNLNDGGGHYLNDLNHPSGAFIHFDTTSDPQNPSTTLNSYHTTHNIQNGGFSMSGTGSFVEVNTHLNLDLNSGGSTNMQSNYSTRIASLGLIQLSGNTVTIDGGTGNVNISGTNTIITGSLNQSGTFYADNISFANSPSITQDTGSYVMTYLSDGTVAYADYPTFGNAVSPYVTASASQNFNGDVTITSGSLVMTGSIHYLQPGFPSILMEGRSSAGTDVETLSIDTYQILFERSGSTIDNVASFGPGGFSTIDNVNYYSSNYSNSTLELDANSGAIGITSDFTYNYGGPWDGPAIYNYDSTYTPTALIGFQNAFTGTTNQITFGTETVSTKGFTQQRLTTDQELTAASDTVVTFNYSDFDPSGWYNAEFFYFQPTVAGVYEVNYSITWVPGISGTGQVNVQVHKNGDQIAINQQQLNLIDNMTQTGTLFVQMNGTTDQLNLTAYTSCSAGQTIAGGNGTYITIKLL